MRYPDYENGILNVICSLQKHVGLEARHKSLPLCDAALEKNYKTSSFWCLMGLVQTRFFTICRRKAF
ncbi:MAG TPA: hypothetical protein PKB13_12595 [Clostridia bacterium]|nr:hypothetical protein [Clostridia bacterium]